MNSGGEMPEKADIVPFVADWWQFGAFMIASFVAYMTGKERQRYKIGQIGQDLERLSKKVDQQGADIDSMRREENANAVHSAEVLTKLITQQGHIIQTLNEIKDALKSKADK